MKKEPLESLFRELHGSFDTVEPRSGHQQRFMEKLQAERKGGLPESPGRNPWWKHLSIAASVAVLVMLGLKLLIPAPTVAQQVANISPEVSQTEFYFASLIEDQVRQLESESSPETQQLVDDTLRQLKKLETSYRQMEQDLLRGGDSKLILGAMITNFQTRIALLQEVLDKIAHIKETNSYDNENYSI